MKCPECECQLSGEAELFLHQAIHGAPLPKFGVHTPLRELSGMQIRRLAGVLEGYAEVVRAKVLAADSDVTLLRGALRQAIDLLTLRLDLGDITDDEKQQRLVFQEILQEKMSERLSDLGQGRPLSEGETMFTKGQKVRVTFTTGSRVGEVTSYPVVIEHSDERGDEKDYSRVGVQFPNGHATVPVKNVKGVE